MSPFRIAMLGIVLLAGPLPVTAEPAKPAAPAVATGLNRVEIAPDLMALVMSHGKQIQLAPSQRLALVHWLERHQRDQLRQEARIMQLEQEIKESMLAGRHKAEIMGQTVRLLNSRRRIVANRIDARDTIQRVLLPEQFQKVLMIYREGQPKS